MADASTVAGSSLYARRQRRNAIARFLALAATAFGLGWLVLILGVLLWEGLGGLHGQPRPSLAGDAKGCLAGHKQGR